MSTQKAPAFTLLPLVGDHYLNFCSYKKLINILYQYTHTYLVKRETNSKRKKMPKSIISASKGAHYTSARTNYTFCSFAKYCTCIHFKNWSYTLQGSYIHFPTPFCTNSYYYHITLAMCISPWTLLVFIYLLGIILYVQFSLLIFFP